MDSVINIALVISILSAALAVANFALTRKDKATKDIGAEQYKMGIIDSKLDGLSKQIDKILDKLDTYEIETDKKIEDALKHHINEYHKEK